MSDDKNQVVTNDESSAERDQDEGTMNNGTIGGDIRIEGNVDKETNANTSDTESHDNKTADSSNKS